MAGTDRDALVGKTLAHNFEILAPIGSGAMGKVYKARQLSLDKIIAIKVLHPHLSGDENVAKRFHREARAASRLNHPNSLQMIDFGTDENGTHYIAMEYLPGRDLADAIRHQFPFTLRRTAHVAAQTLSALEEAHAAGIIHRDLKPENILLVSLRGDPDFVKVCDFGIAKIQDPKGDDPHAAITIAGLVCGTPEYMSPEQARGEPLDARSDLYSMGCILYELATGARPFSAESALGVVTKHLTEPPIPPSQLRPELNIDAGLERLILRALSKRREERHGTASEMRAAVEKVLIDAEGHGISSQTLQAASLIAPAAVARSSTGMTPLTAEVTAAPSVPPSRGRVLLWGAAIVGALAIAAGGYAFLDHTPDGSGARTHVGGQVGPRTAPPTPSASSPATRAPAPEPTEAVTPVAPDGNEVEPEPAGPGGRPGGRERRRRVGSASRPPVASRAGAPAAAPTPPPALPPPPPAPTIPPPVAAPSLIQQATQLFRAANCRDALPLLERARAETPHSAEVFRLLGRCYSRAGRTGEAQAAYRRFLEISPNSPEAESIRALVQ